MYKYLQYFMINVIFSVKYNYLENFFNYFILEEFQKFVKSYLFIFWIIFRFDVFILLNLEMWLV